MHRARGMPAIVMYLCTPSSCTTGAQCTSAMAGSSMPLPWSFAAHHAEGSSSIDVLRSVSTAPEPPPPRA
ncbi:MAG TPA: hypothetical protein VFW98_11420 [Gemmatimonadaceae bacterium]|nr:hypothetical protein [Gemmatimonadaceae bacterium]